MDCGKRKRKRNRKYKKEKGNTFSFSLLFWRFYVTVTVTIYGCSQLNSIHCTHLTLHHYIIRKRTTDTKKKKTKYHTYNHTHIHTYTHRVHYLSILTIAYAVTTIIYGRLCKSIFLIISRDNETKKKEKNTDYHTHNTKASNPYIRTSRSLPLSSDITCAVTAII